MPNFGELKDQVIAELGGHTIDTPAIGTLVGDVGPTSLELALDFGDSPGAARPNGLVEVDNELIFISRFDPTNGVATIPVWGRGQRNTVAATHTAGTPVTVRPRFPRKKVGDTLNQVVASSCPPLFAATDLPVIDTDAFVGLGFPLPDNTLRVLRVEATERLVPDVFARRHVLRDWTVRNIAGTQLIELDRGVVFQHVQVTIAAAPAKLVNDADDFAVVTGLPESAADLMVFGAIARLILGGELAKQQVSNVEAAQRAVGQQSGTGATISRYFQGLYGQRLEAETTRLQQLYPLILRRVG